MTSVIEEYQADLIEAGLKECQKLLPQQEGNMIPFYEGSIESFERMKDLSFEKIKNALDESRKEEFRLFAYRPSLNKEELADYWRQRGRTTQLEFIHERLHVFLIMHKQASVNHG